MSNDVDKPKNYQNVLIRSINTQDIEIISAQYCFPWSSSQETEEKWRRYLKEQQKNIRTVGIIEMNGEILGYGSLLLHSAYPYFANIPEIHDVWIHQNHRKSGLAKRLIAWLEELARKKGFTEIGIGVGLYADYGPAQRLYFQLGYIPDGRGITYKYHPTSPGKTYPLDDDLILWLKKPLNQQRN